MEELTIYLRALLVVSLETLKPPEERQRPELLLERAGMRRKEIAALLQKSEAAVAKSIERAKRSATAKERKGDIE